MVAGCSSPNHKPPPDVDLMPEPVVTVPRTNAPPVTVPKTNTATNSVAQPIVAVPTNHFELSETWIPLERWCQTHGFPAPRHDVNDNVSRYSFVTTNGTMTIQIGSKNAIWRGADYMLGFAPQVVKGHPCVNTLDIRKNFLPLLENPAPGKMNHVLVIDPGHGGTDTGTKSAFNGHFEKEFTLDLARRLQSLLAANGWTVWLTRTNDVYLSLPDRVAIADQHQAGLFLSLHFNSSFPDQNETGLETYCVTPRGMSSYMNRGFVDDPALIFPNNSFDAENIQYAARLHRAALKVNGHLDRGVRRARFLRVLREQNRPAVLMEVGYLSNLREARRIADPEYRQRFAEVLAQALMENPGHPPAPAGQLSAAPRATNQFPAAVNHGPGHQPEGQSD